MIDKSEQIQCGWCGKRHSENWNTIRKSVNKIRYRDIHESIRQRKKNWYKCPQFME